MNTRLAVIGLVIGALAVAAPVQATPISGSLSFASVPGYNSVYPILPDGSMAADFSAGAGATALDFTTTALLTPGVDGVFVITSASGDFLGLVGSEGALGDFSFIAPGSLDYPYIPLPSVMAGIGGFRFDLLAITNILRTSGTLVLEGSGSLWLDGFDVTPGIWNLTANKAGASLSFSGSAASVPDAGSSLLLMGLGLVGLRLWKRR